MRISSLISNVFVISFASLSFLTSCSNDVELKNNVSLTNDTFFSLNGLECRLPLEMKESDFTINSEDFMATLTSKTKARTGSNGPDWSKVNSKALYKLIEKEMKTLPDLPNVKQGNSDWAKLKKDFPGLTKYDDLEKHGTTISDYYSNIIRFRITPEVIKMLEAKNTLRIEDQIVETPLESMLTTLHPVAGWSVNVAREYYENFFIYTVGINNDGHNLNAMKHAAWNAKCVQEMMSRAMSKSTSISRTRLFTTAHEYRITNSTNCPGNYSSVSGLIPQAKVMITWMYNGSSCSFVSELPYNEEQAMDLSNNLVGRQYMEDNASFWSRPKTETINTHFFGKACIAIQRNKNDIVSNFTGATDEEKLKTLALTETKSGYNSLIFNHGATKYSTYANGTKFCN